MFRYYFELGVRSLRRNPMLTLLMVVTLAVGVAASMATFTVLYVMSGDPIPSKSDRLFVPRLDNAPLQGYAAGYPLGMALLAAATVQAGICLTMFSSRLLKAVLAANFLLFLSHALVISHFLTPDGGPAMFQLGDFASAVLGSASLVFTPVETMALIVREAYLKRLRRPRRDAPP